MQHAVCSAGSGQGEEKRVCAIGTRYGRTIKQLSPFKDSSYTLHVYAIFGFQRKGLLC